MQVIGFAKFEFLWREKFLETDNMGNIKLSQKEAITCSLILYILRK